jgi:predicted CXXCH cytochrome family protein
VKSLQQSSPQGLYWERLAGSVEEWLVTHRESYTAAANTNTCSARPMKCLHIHTLTLLINSGVTAEPKPCKEEANHRIQLLQNATQTKNPLLWTARNILGLALAFIALCPFAQAARHPVPLDPNVDSSACLACHADKTKGKSVHSAMAMGCLSCHQVRVYRGITRVKLITTNPAALCFTCHADKNPADIKGKIHPPAVRDCLTCHDPHSSDNKYQLLKPTSGDKGDNLCLSCHTQGVNVPANGSRHAALDMGCDTCHTVHKTGDPEKTEFAYHLNKAIPQLCLDCHDPKDADLQKAHDNQPFATANCIQCHNPHQSKYPALLQTFLHPPFESKQCDTCHAPAKDGKVVLTQSDAKALCVTCHADVESKIENAKVPHPGAMGECTDCHNPHAGASPGFLQPNPVSACLACHTDQAEQGHKKYPHQPAFVQGCGTCHDGHGNDNAHLLRVANVNALCLECHGPDAKPQKLDDTNLVTIFNGAVKLPGNYFAQVPILPLKYGLGHPVDGHPVSDIHDPGDLTKVTIALNCLSCHQPHASAQPNLLVNDQANNTAFCSSCHKNLMK